MRIVNLSLAIALGLALAPAAAMAQSANSSVPPVSPKSSVTTTARPATVGEGANASVPKGGPGIVKEPHVKHHKREHHKMFGKHHDYVRSGTKKGPASPHMKKLGTVQ